MAVEQTYFDLNASLVFRDEEGNYQFDNDKKATRQYFLEHVNLNTAFFHTLEEKLKYLFEEGYYKKEIFDQYSMKFIKSLYKKTYDKKFRFPSFMGAYKFYTSYAMKTTTGDKYLERYEDRIVVVALTLAKGSEPFAVQLMEEMISGRFQPATPTFLNAGKLRAGEQVSCFPEGTLVDTINGQVDIKNISIGDMVLTEDGKYRKVLATNKRKYTGNIKRIKVVGHPEILVTPEHPFLVRVDADDDRHDSHGGYNNVNFKWIVAKDLKPNYDQLVMAFPSVYATPRKYTLIDYIEKFKENKNGRKKSGYVVEEGIIKYTNQDKKLNKKKQYSESFRCVNNEVEENYDFGRFLGYYISEGNLGKRTGGYNYVSVNFTFGKHENKFIEDLEFLSKKIFGVEPTRNTNHNDNSVKVCINNVFVANFIYDICKTGFGNKIFSKETLFSNDDFIFGILVGAIRGDGNVTGNSVQLHLTNPALIHQLKLLSIKIGLLPKVRYYVSASGKITGTLSFTGSNDNNEKLIFAVDKTLYKYSGACARSYCNKSINFNDVVDGKPVALLQSIEEIEFSDYVYNIQVEDNPTYSVNGIVVHNCFLMTVSDSMESISRCITNSLQLSKRGGGVGILLTDIREDGAPIKDMDGMSSGVVPIMKILEDSFSYANQLGARQGAGVVYLHAHHPDILKFLDTKRENADEKVRIKTLSLGVVIPDITMKLAAKNDNMYLFSPYDIQKVYGKTMSEIDVTELYDEMVENKNIRKTKINARELLQNIATIQQESGYPYLLFEGNANRGNTGNGRINMSNLCVEGDAKFEISSDPYGQNTISLNFFELSKLLKEGMGHNLYVKTFDTSSGHPVFSKLTGLHGKGFVDKLVEIEYEGKTVRVTLDHEIFTHNRGWVKAQDLHKHDILEVYGNVEKAGSEISLSVVTLADPVEVFDLSVENDHSFYANDILVHNCIEILQENEHSTFHEDGSYNHVGKDISCNLASQNIAKMMDHGDFETSVEAHVRALTNVSRDSNIKSVPSIQRGNQETCAIGLGGMNLHGYLGREKIMFGSEESIDFTSVYFSTVRYYALKASNKMAIEEGRPFVGFEETKYANGMALGKYVTEDWQPKTAKVKKLFAKVKIPTNQDWADLTESIIEHGIANKYLMAIAPTGSISYINNSTSSIHPITDKIETRKEGKIGRVRYAAPYLTNDNVEYYQDAYEIGPEKLIDVYAAAAQHIDQSISATLFLKAKATTRDINKAQVYAFKKGLKSLYYIRLRQEALGGTEITTECASCTI